MGANKRIQLNIQLKKYSHLPELKHLQPVTYLPVYYGSEEGGITDSLARDFKSEVFLPRNGINGALIAVIALAGKEGRDQPPFDGSGITLGDCY